MGNPILVVDGQGFDLFDYVTNPKNGKSYFVPKSDQSSGQRFGFGVAVDAEIFPKGIHSTVGILDDSGTVVPLKGVIGKNKGGNDVVRFSANLTINGEPMHVANGTGSSLSQRGDGSMNLRLNIVKGHIGTGFDGQAQAESRKVQATKVAIPA